jgi:hypothetical protein
MRHNRVRRSVRAHEGSNRFGALDYRRAPWREVAWFGLVVAGQVESDDAVPRLYKWLDEHTKVRAAPAPAVNQVHRGAIAPGLPRYAVPGPSGLDRNARRYAWRHAQARFHGRRSAPQLDGPPRPDRGRESLEQPECPAHSRLDRWLDARSRLVPGQSRFADHQQSPSELERILLASKNAV